MSNEQRGLEVKVGFFVFVGLMAIAIMAIQFGRVGQGLAKDYRVTVEFPNANGLLKNSDVQMAGAAIGHVAERPEITGGQIGKVFVQLSIRDEIKLPKGSRFVIGSSGLLGDKFVNVEAPDHFKDGAFDPADPNQIIPPGAQLKADQSGGLDAITKKGEEAMVKLNSRLDELEGTIAAVRNGLLSDENLKNLSGAFADFKAATGRISEASKKIDGLMVGAQSTVDNAKDTMAGARKMMETAEGAASDVRAVVGEARGVIQSTQGFLKSAQSGPGALPMLLGNREVANNLRAIISNIRQHGLIFYRDSAAREAAESQPRR
ncbi:MAG: MlaD family protein [Verrucomicrobiota bacterium]